MLFSHDVEHALAWLVDLVNTESQGPTDGLADLPALEGFVRRHALSDVGALTSSDLLAVQELRARVRRVFTAESDHEAAELVNALIVDSPVVTPRLTNHDGYPWHVHYFAPGAALAEHLAVDGGMALAQLIALGERERLRICEAPDCAQVLVDLSRNRSKRYCDARTCGNRIHVAAYRERRRAETG